MEEARLLIGLELYNEEKLITMQAQTSAQEFAEQPKLFGHPIGLYVCALTEMWERFSFYGMKFLLMLYLTKYHLMTDVQGYDVLANYAALVYALPLVGGLLADRYLGMRKAVIWGGILLCLGHLGMAFEGTQAYVENGQVVQDNLALKVFYFSLALIIAGVGFLKPNISTIVGRLYPEGDPHRDSGFTVFYMGINTGSFLATMTCGYLGETFGWAYGFGLAGIGMVAGLIIFTFGQKYLYGHAEPANPEVLKESGVMGMNKERTIYAATILSLFVIWGLVQNHGLVQIILYGSLGLWAVWLVYFMIAKCSPIERSRMGVLAVLIIFSIVFWALFEQAGGSMTMFADRVMDRPEVPFFGQLTASQFGSFNALFIILLAPVFAWLWIAMGKAEPSTPVKFALGIMLVGLGFGCLVYGIGSVEEGQKAHYIWMILAYLLHSMGELCLSPVGLSAVTKLSVGKVVGVMMGAWFLATALSEFLAFGLSKMAAVSSEVGETATIPEMMEIYGKLFEFLLYIGVGCGIFVLILSPWLKKGMKGIH